MPADDDHLNDDFSTPDQETEESEPTQIEIRAIGADDLDAKYVNFASINFDRAALYLTLSQFLPPTLSKPADAKRISEQGFVPAKAVGRFVLTPLMVEELLSLMQTQLDNFRSAQQAERTDSRSEDMNG